ncbi:MAG: LytTR family transcriptional regulator [Flavobacteriales bacterium]|nr:LytTR family transcriptional regulator [Flavobacteriales bacterium]MCB9448617.1 LytTR family transcriptional regulator [Flavobacteriales bacterium]
MKPVDEPELVNAIKLAQQKIENKGSRARFAKDRLILSNQQGMIFTHAANIIRVEADSNYSTFYFNDQQRQVISRNVGYYEELLVPHNFFRIHQKHLVNLSHVKKFIKGDIDLVEMCDDSRVEVSRRRKGEFLQAMKANEEQAS